MRAGRRAGAEAGSRAFAALRGRGLRGRGGGWPAGSPGAIVEGKGALPRSASVRRERGDGRRPSATETVQSPPRASWIVAG